MSIKLVHAVGNKDGVSGDSSGNEITIAKFYTNKTYPWGYLCICKDLSAAQKACEEAKAIAENNNYGYSQSERLTGPESVLKNGISKGSGEFDCSSLCSFVYYR